MRRQTFGPHGRRGTLIAASAAVLCLGGSLAGCGDGTGGEGYTAVGAAQSGPGRTPSGAVAPSGKVTLVPLDGDRRGGGDGRPGSTAPSGSPGSLRSPGSSAKGRGTGGPGAPGTPGRTADGTGSGTGTGSGGGGTGPTGGSGGSNGSGSGGSTPSGSNGPGDSGSSGGSNGSGGSTAPATPPAPGSTAPAGPAVLKVGAPGRAAADHRWCEKVTVEFRNTGGSPVRSGTVTFATHIIGGLGIDWATRESTAPLPAPIDAGAARKKTYTVCMDDWRVPLGMHVETRDVTAVWK
ncbi:hypothetical protein EDD93_1914 [Streptomyces sp. 840.1]|uniref:hypothetical protein n=1 Tax=Streptomyces sp. 840.1 TaxID=2485152 RepID=UPI000F485226|nr:hypothetical protein [Streptomyces sp. 840.1]ROQ67477.1 hypothetical protein EDD93_1914 [Streptomyces sp. 840.1]